MNNLKLTGHCLEEFYKINNIIITEGSVLTAQANEIKDIMKKKNPKKIMEIGFNAGYSAEVFLANSRAYVHSFDIGHHYEEYLKFGKIYVNNKFGNRHTIVFGNSLESVPRFHKNNDLVFDIIFIDGGHEYSTAYSDLMNCKLLSNSETIIIMDDIVSNESLHAGHTRGPTQAWNEFVENNWLIEISHTDYEFGRGQSVGKYLF